MSAVWSTSTWIGAGIGLALACFVLPVLLGKGIKAADDNLDVQWDRDIEQALALVNSTPHMPFGPRLSELDRRRIYRQIQDRRGGAR